MEALPKALAAKLHERMDWELLEALCEQREAYILESLKTAQPIDQCEQKWGQMEACRWLGKTLRKIVENTLKA